MYAFVSRWVQDRPDGNEDGAEVTYFKDVILPVLSHRLPNLRTAKVSLFDFFYLYVLAVTSCSV